MSGTKQKKRVVCAWILNAAGEILLTQRKAGTHLAHMWEFPGGKIEPGESPEQALVRELKEEIAIDAQIGAEISRVEHEYLGKDGAPWIVELLLLEVLQYVGTPTAVDVADVKWVSREWLDANLHVLPPADIPLVQNVRMKVDHPV
jgi:8-oxo-dGTP diphosphatase